MGWKDWPYWLKGSIIFTVLYTLIGGYFVFFSFIEDFLFLLGFLFFLFFGIIFGFYKGKLSFLKTQNNKIYWLIGTYTGILVSIILYVLLILPFVLILLSWGSQISVWEYFLSVVISFIVSVIVISIIGTIIGWIYGKIK